MWIYKFYFETLRLERSLHYKTYHLVFNLYDALKVYTYNIRPIFQFGQHPIYAFLRIRWILSRYEWKTYFEFRQKVIYIKRISKVKCFCLCFEVSSSFKLSKQMNKNRQLSDRYKIKLFWLFSLFVITEGKRMIFQS